MIAYTSRSPIIAHQRCPRSRYLGYHWGGTGVRLVRMAIPLATGTYVHTGLASMLRDVRDAEVKGVVVAGLVAVVDVEKAVKAALDGYKDELKARQLDVELGEDGAYVADEQLALVEALLRVYYVAPDGLRALVDQYRVLEVEQDDCWEGFTTLEDGTRVDLETRADGLLQERSTGDLYVLSFKTTAAWDYRKDNDARHDVQGLSEAVGIERRMVAWWKDIHDSASAERNRNEAHPTVQALRALGPDEQPRIMGVQMVHLIKGRREQQGDGGPYVTQSHLLRGWKREGVTEPEYAWRYKWEGPDVWPDSGKLKGHTLGKGWTRFDAWREFDGGVKEWIDMLASRTVQADIDMDPFYGIVVQPLPYFRQDQDMQDWVEQAQAQEREVFKVVLDVERARTLKVRGVEAPADYDRKALNAFVRQHRHACDYPSRCQFQAICFGDQSMLTNPVGSGLYQIREAHHERERAARVGVSVSNREDVEQAAAGE